MVVQKKAKNLEARVRREGEVQLDLVASEKRLSGYSIAS